MAEIKQDHKKWKLDLEKEVEEKMLLMSTREKMERKIWLTSKKFFQPNLCYVNMVKLIAHNLKLALVYRAISVTTEKNQRINNHTHVVFLNVTQCDLADTWHFVATCCLHHQGCGKADSSAILEFSSILHGETYRKATTVIATEKTTPNLKSIYTLLCFTPQIWIQFFD